jgi:hypothetical protein
MLRASSRRFPLALQFGRGSNVLDACLGCVLAIVGDLVGMKQPIIDEIRTGPDCDHSGVPRSPLPVSFRLQLTQDFLPYYAFDLLQVGLLPVGRRGYSTYAGAVIIPLLKRYPRLYGAIRHGVYGRMQSLRRSTVFDKVYRENEWGDGFSVSGPGSNLGATENIRHELPGLMRSIGARSLLDIPCGDFAWMSKIPRDFGYVGADLVGALVARNQRTYPGVRFLRLDLIKDTLPSCDAVLVRDCFVHLTNREIAKAVSNIRRSGAKFLLATTFPDTVPNQDTVPPCWRPLNLSLPPFDLGPPTKTILDYSPDQPNDQGKHLGVWKL